MPAKQLRCDVSVIPEGDGTGENAIECGAIALACADCGVQPGVRSTPKGVQSVERQSAQDVKMATPAAVTVAT
jgi:hypothetical protein